MNPNIQKIYNNIPGRIKRSWSFQKIKNLILRKLYFSKTLKNIDIESISKDDIVLSFDHNKGGGSEKLSQDYINHIKKNCTVLQFRSYFGAFFEITIYKGERSLKYQIKKIEDLILYFDRLKIKKIIINQLTGYYSHMELLQILISNVTQKDIFLEIHLHDFYYICPTLNLIDYKNNFCFACLDTDYCRVCIKKNKIPSIAESNIKFENINIWRSAWGELLKLADNIVVYSDFTKEMYSNIFTINEKKIEKKKVLIENLRKVNYKQKNNICLIIGVLGRIDYKKGGKMLLEIAEIIDEKQINAKILVFGTIENNYLHNKMRFMGSYNQKDLPELMELYRVDIVLMPSICGETYNLVVDEVMAMGMPIAVFNIGAPPERVKEYEKGLIINKIDANYCLEKIVEYVNDRNYI